MHTALKLITLSLILFALAACQTPAASPTPTLAPTDTTTPSPTITETPTLTATPTDTATPTEPPSVVSFTLPTGKPAAEWHGIPIMPGAIAGDGDSSGYAFTIKATAEEVQAFYDKKLTQLGWKSLASGQGTTGALLLIYTKGTDMVTLSAFPQSDGLMYVMMVD